MGTAITLIGATANVVSIHLWWATVKEFKKAEKKRNEK